MKKLQFQVLEITGPDFKKLIHAKGWKMKDLAARWGCTPDWVGQLCRRDERPLAYNDAILGLPNLRFLHQENQRRRRQIERACKVEEGAATPSIFSVQQGDVLTAMEDVGSLAYEGDRVLVIQTLLTSGMKRYGILFSSGDFDWFWQPDIDHYFAQTGIENEYAKNYLFKDVATLRDDFMSGSFVF